VSRGGRVQTGVKMQTSDRAKSQCTDASTCSEASSTQIWDLLFKHSSLELLWIFFITFEELLVLASTTSAVGYTIL
jgi:hypothetical protein